MFRWLILFALAAWPAAAQPASTTIVGCTNWAAQSVGDLGYGIVRCDSTGAIVTTPSAAATGGATMARYLSAASTNSNNVKASAGTLYTLTAINTTTSIYYLKLYNKATAPTCNSDTVVGTYPVPASVSANGFILSVPVGLAFSTGIGFCLTGALADNDNTNAATGVAINFAYK